MKNTLDILAFGAHPDDVEIGCGGTLAKEAIKGSSVGIIDFTMGELGTGGSKEIRKEESLEAKEILGLKIRENFYLQDAFFIDSYEERMMIIEKIRLYRPSVVMCPPNSDRHPDHARCSKMVQECCFLAGLDRIKIKSLPAWRPSRVISYIMWDLLTPTFFVDISNFLDIKIQSIVAYKSQFYNPNRKDPTTPISSKEFLDSISHRAKEFGKLCFVNAAEGFIIPDKKPLLFESILDLN